MEWVYFLVVLAGCGVIGWLAVLALNQRSLGAVAGGFLFLFAAVTAPILLAYGWLYGVFAATAGGVVCAIQRFNRASQLGRLGLIASTALIGIAPLAWLEVGNISASERIARCQGNVAIATIEGDRAQNGFYPPTVHDFAVDSDSIDYEDQNCPIYQDVNWLYRQSPRGYTVGYWISWLAADDVCLHSSGQQGWRCGLNQWDGFHPGETDG